MTQLNIFDEIVKHKEGSDFILKAAATLYSLMLYSCEELTIKKYGRIEEPVIETIFQKLEEITREMEHPVVYIKFDPETMALHRQQDSTEFYKSLVGKVLDSIEKTQYKDEDGVKRFREQYETDFGSIYTHNAWASLLSSCYNESTNIKTLVNTMFKDKSKRPILLINITVLPSYPKNSVTVKREVGKLIEPSAKDFNWSASYVSAVMMSFFSGGEGLRKTIAVPGWTIDILKNSWVNQEWNTSGYAEGAILEELSFRKIVEL